MSTIRGSDGSVQRRSRDDEAERNLQANDVAEMAMQEVADITRIVTDAAQDVARGIAQAAADPSEVPSALDKLLDRLASSTPAQQITTGGITGWFTGFLFSKIGKPVIYLLGGGVVVVLVAEHQGYLHVDWSRVRNDYSSGRRVVENRIRSLNRTNLFSRQNGRPWTQKIKVLLQTSPYIGGGFLGGLLLGLAS